MFIKIYFVNSYNYIKYTFILSMLKYLGFGPHFIQSISKLFTNVLDYLTINGQNPIPLAFSSIIIRDIPQPPYCMCFLSVVLVTYFLIMFLEGQPYIFHCQSYIFHYLNLQLNLLMKFFCNDSFLTKIGEKNNIVCKSPGSNIHQLKTQCFK